MLIRTIDREYTLYIGADDVWTMHIWDRNALMGLQWRDSFIGVSERDPFKSIIEYDVWA